MPLATPNNCWPVHLQKFADALAASSQFKALVGLPDGTAEEVGRFVFGQRMTHPRSGPAWTVGELEDLLHYGLVFGDPSSPYGKHRTATSHYAPHGTTIVALGRLVPEEDQQPEPELVGGKSGLSDRNDRDWQNIVGTILDQIIAWLNENGGPWPVTNVDVLADYQTTDKKQKVQGTWQICELMFSWGREG
jgi:hypothetical protein